MTRPASFAKILRPSFTSGPTKPRSCRRYISLQRVSNPSGDPQLKDNIESEERAEKEAYFRKRKADWKRRQGGQSFLDHLIVNVRAGTGGDGCVAFHREKFVPYGPPSGGNGGRGGDVYICPTPHLTTLSSVPKRIRGNSGASGQGSFQNGRQGAPLVIKVPLGTVVRELTGSDPRRAKNEWEAEEESYEGMDMEERKRKWRERRWVHYPEFEGDNSERDDFKTAEYDLRMAEREMRIARRVREANPISLDLDRMVQTERPVDAPLGTGRYDEKGTLIASGGLGGYGNPHFMRQDNRSPKWATRGYEGERVTLSLELKLLADVGLVGMPNAGKSTLLRALTGGRAKSEVASYAFTTLNPVVGVVRVAEDGTLMGGSSQEMVHDETWAEEQREKEMMESGAYANAPTRNQGRHQHDDEEDIVERFRFTIADNPGLLSGASENVGLGHSFLRSMERSLALVYVVDFSAPDPWNQVAILRDELETYKPGMSDQARMVIANKADLLAQDGDPEEVEAARQKLQQLEGFVRSEMRTSHGQVLDVVAISGKYSQNLRRVVKLMEEYVEEARAEQSQEPLVLSTV